MSERIAMEIAAEPVARRHFAPWSEGMPDHSCTIHSIGVSYWSRLGDEFGYVAVSEMPLPEAGKTCVGDDLRSDSAWFPANSPAPVVLVEFERYAGAVDAPKLQQKVENLLLAYHRWQASPTDLILCYWTKSLTTLPDHAAMAKRFCEGFETRAKERVPGAPAGKLLMYQAVLGAAAEGRWRFWQMKQRGEQ